MIKKYAESAVALLQSIIRIPSLSGQESAVADLLCGYLNDHGIVVERVGNNVIARSFHFDTTKQTLLLDAHIDTVAPVDGWTKDPYTPILLEDKLYGLGSNDTGGSIVAMLMTFIHFYNRKDCAYNLVYLASAEEENSGAGGVELAYPYLGDVDLMIAGEPTQMHPAIAEKGLLVLDCKAYGQAGHAARGEGINAIDIALENIKKLYAISFEEESSLLGPVKVNCTQIAAGHQHNVIPATCEFVVDVRTNEFYSNQQVVDIVRKELSCEVIPRSTRMNASSIDIDHPLVKRAKVLGRIPYGSPTTSNQALLPVTSLKMGPGDSARSHTADEYIKCSEIEEGIEVFIKLLERL